MKINEAKKAIKEYVLEYFEAALSNIVDEFEHYGVKIDKSYIRERNGVSLVSWRGSQGTIYGAYFCFSTSPYEDIQIGSDKLVLEKFIHKCMNDFAEDNHDIQLKDSVRSINYTWRPEIGWPHRDDDEDATFWVRVFVVVSNK